MDDVLTAAEIATVLQADTARIEQAERRLTEQRQSRNHLLSVYGDTGPTAAAVRAEQDERLADVERATAVVATSAAQNAREILRQLERVAQPALSGEDLARAAHLRDELREATSVSTRRRCVFVWSPLVASAG